MKRYKLLVLTLYKSFLLLLIYAQTPNIFENFDFSFSFPFSNTRWNLHDAMVSSNFIILTRDIKSSEGAIWCTTPVPFRDWEIVIQFQIYGHGENLYGDGMALWYVKDKEEKGPVFGSRDNFTGLGIFLDTYNNYNDINDHQHPYISAQVNDGTRQYNKDKDGTDTQIAGFHTNFRGADKHPIIVISYVRNTLEVKMTYDHFKTVEKCFEVKGIHLPTGYYFGASAATGELSDNHVITSFRVFPVIVDRTGKEAEEDPSKISPYAEFFSPPRDHVSKPKHIPMTAKKLVLIIILALIGLAVLFVVGVLVFKKQEESRKRLY